MTYSQISGLLEVILKAYKTSFTQKELEEGAEESSEVDDLMRVFGLSQDMKARNKQYWGRELGMCWQRLVKKLCQHTCYNFQDGIKEGGDEFCDLVIGDDAIDTKYRIGSGDSGTLKKFKSYGQTLKARGLNPVQLILRSDNLPAAITACKTGGWEILVNGATFSYIEKVTGFDLRSWLIARRAKYPIDA